ncbi:sensor histidine kinase, partial [Acidiphilium sp.]|uniref:sensor histidine kinase n=1 Tax=Acidiphilium sp. TaxID=527 RepID=UPI003D01B264
MNRIPPGSVAMSLRARLFGLWLMSLFGSIVVAVLILGLFRQTETAHRERDRAVAARACQAITMRYDFYTAGMAAVPDPVAFDAGLHAVLLLALQRDRGIAGGIAAVGSSASATLGVIPTARSSGLDRQIGEAVAADRLIVTTKGGFLDRTTIATCPLGGPLGTPVANLAAFTVLRADLLRSAFTRFAFGGLAVLLATLLASAAFLAWMVLGFSRRLAGVEAALTADQPGALALTGEVELDRLITALNAANTRLDAARARIAQSERLAALGRMAAGLAHEIRNPLGAIRLRAETGLAQSGACADPARQTAALRHILIAAARLETLTRRLLGFAATPSPQPRSTALDPLIAEAIASQDRTDITAPPSGVTWTLDPILTRGAIENLLRNAVAACRSGDSITITAEIGADPERGAGAHLIITIA